MKKRDSSQRSDLSNKIKKMSLFLIPLLIGYFMISNVIINNIRKQTIQDLGAVSELYMNELDHKFIRISRRILLMIMDGGEVNNLIYQYADNLSNQKDPLEYYYQVDRLKQEFLHFSWEYGSEYHFFIYHSDSGTYLNLDLDVQEGIDNQQLMTELIPRLEMDKEATYSAKKTWDSINLGDTQYIYKCVNRNGVYLGCYADAIELLTPFEEIDLGQDGYVQLLDGDGQTISSTGNGIQSDYDALSLYSHTIDQKMKRAPFTIRIYVSSERISVVFMGVLLGLVVTILLFLVIYMGSLLYLRKHVLKPIQQFVLGLSRYEDDGYVYSITDSNILELEQADEQFRKMFRQIKKLKITLYEKELEERNLEIANLKLQVKPHFYLNCLNFIYSMIYEKQYESAKEMAKATSNYLRSLFQNDFAMILIEEELEQCKNYLAILSMRYQNTLEYFIEQDEDTKGSLIFPFFIQTFVENSLKHGFRADKKMTLSITVYPEKCEDDDYVNIYIADNGKGFSEEVLKRLKQGQSGKTMDKRHIGIDNCIRRMELYFGGRGWINFDNNIFGGAIVDIHIPIERQV